MKRLILIMALLMLLSSCSEVIIQTDNNAPDMISHTDINLSPSEAPFINDGYDDYFEYPSEAVCFYVDEECTVYIAGQVDLGGQDPQTITDFSKLFTLVSAYDLDGNKLAEYKINAANSISHLCAGGGMLFYTLTYDPDGFYSFNLSTGEQTKLDVLTNIFTMPDAIKKFVYRNGNLYILGILEDYITNEYDDVLGIDVASGQAIYTYQYDGRVLVSYNIENKTAEIVFDDLIYDFSPTPYGSLMIHAYDPEYDRNAHQTSTSYYFTEFNLQSMTIGERIYRDTRNPESFATDGQGIMISAFLGASIQEAGKIYYWSLGANTGASELVSGVQGVRSDSIMYANGFTFYLTTATNKSGSGFIIARVKNSAYINYESPIKIIGTNVHGEILRGGYNIDFTKIENDQFALAVLSGGISYDIAYVWSQQDNAHNIRKQGAFYPLDDVPGIKKYIDACFPYIREAATDKNGEIWMIPISNNVPGIIYSEANCRTASLNMGNTTIIEDVIQSVIKCAQYDPSGTNFQFNSTQFIKMNLIKYLSNNDTFDTAEFRTLAPMLKDFMKDGAVWGASMPHLSEDGTPNPDFLFDNISLQTSKHLIDRTDLSIIPLTGTIGASPADIVFLCVNPNSDKIDKLLEYISYICETLMMERKDTGLFEDIALYTASEYARERYEMYRNAVVHFSISDEIFSIDFNRYLNSEIDLETLIKEAGRKLAMYLGE